MAIWRLSMPRLERWDIAIAIVAAVAVVLEASLRETTSLPVGAYPLALVATAPLAFRRRAPLPVFFAVALSAFTISVALSATWTATVIVLLELYTVALYGDRNRSLVIGVLSAIAVVLVIVLIDGEFDLGGVAVRVPMIFAAVAAGDTRRARNALAAATAEREARSERDREQESQRRLLAARMGIARDVHDTLAHALVEINVRAGVTAHVKGQDPQLALAYIKRTSAQALNDLRVTLGVLRDPEESAPTAPTPGLDGVQELVRRAQEAGLAADADIGVDAMTVPSAIGQVGFRVIQEGLTNVLRHANATATHVRIAVDDDELEIAVTDDGRRSVAPNRNGYGLRGMRERVAALGGQLEAGPAQSGGWCIRARMPLSTGKHA